MNQLKELELVDYLLLDYLVFYPLPFFVLFKSERLNKPAIDLDVEEIALQITCLSKNNFIVISTENGRTLKLSVKEIYSLLKQAIDYNSYTKGLINLKKKLLAPKKFIYSTIRLTNLGVERWEHFFEPDWSKYCSESEIFGEIGGEHRIIFEACSKKVIQEMSSITLKYLTSYSSKWKVIKPWKPFYWKEFELGHALELSFLENGMDIESSLEDTKTIYTLRKWKKEWNQNWLEGLY
ncbi:MAG: hypothetical protein BWK78_04925 [Thiotrichaceae bacterium IS1]|nr:MAG: hypothetical protein BWK78_04925 [Thiotrichaceae bacterium IS1]